MCDVMVFLQATEALSSNDSVELLQASVEVTSQLAEATSDRTVSLLPTDLQTTNAILNQVVDILEDSIEIATSTGIGQDEVCDYKNVH